MSRDPKHDRHYALDVDLLKPSGVLQRLGAVKRQRPMTITRWQRFKRWLRATFPNWRSN